MRGWSELGRALLLRCPRCGSRGMVGRWGRFREDCPGCGHHYEREEGYWLGAVLLNTVAAVAALALALIGLLVATWPDVPWGPATAVVVAVSIVVPVLFYPWAKALWVALDLMVRPPGEPDR